MNRDLDSVGLINCFALLGVDNIDTQPAIVVRHTYPPLREKFVQQVSPVCFPLGLQVSYVNQNSYEPVGFTSACTDIDGSYWYVHVIKIHPCKQPEVTFVAVSRHCFVRPMRQLLMYLVDLAMVLPAKHLFCRLISLALFCPSPPPNVCLRMTVHECVGDIIFGGKNGSDNDACMQLLDCLGPGALVDLFCAAIFEGQIVVTTRRGLSLLFNACNALKQLLGPFQWEGGFIPLLSPSLVPFLEAPTPFIVGLPHETLTSWTEGKFAQSDDQVSMSEDYPSDDNTISSSELLPNPAVLNDLVVCDLDTGVVKLPESFQMAPLPKQEFEHIVRFLCWAKNPTLDSLDLPEPYTEEESTPTVHFDLIALEFSKLLQRICDAKNCQQSPQHAAFFDQLRSTQGYSHFSRTQARAQCMVRTHASMSTKMESELAFDLRFGVSNDPDAQIPQSYTTQHHAPANTPAQIRPRSSAKICRGQVRGMLPSDVPHFDFTRAAETLAETFKMACGMAAQDHFSEGVLTQATKFVMSSPDQPEVYAMRARVAECLLLSIPVVTHAAQKIERPKKKPEWCDCLASPSLCTQMPLAIVALVDYARAERLDSTYLSFCNRTQDVLALIPDDDLTNLCLLCKEDPNVHAIVSTEKGKRDAIKAAHLAKVEEARKAQLEQKKRQQQQAKAKLDAFEPWVKNNNAEKRTLNSAYTWIGTPRNACDVVIELMGRIMPLLLQQVEVEDDGSTCVCPKRLTHVHETEEFLSFVKFTAELQVVDVKSLDNNCKLLFWLNLHNLLCLHANVEASTTLLILVATARYNVGGMLLTAIEVEHAIIRHTLHRPRVVASHLLVPKWDVNDPRAVVCPDARQVANLVQFGLCHGLQTDPPLTVFVSPSSLGTALQKNAARLLKQVMHVHPDRKSICVPRLMSWFRRDYGKGKESDILQLVSSICSDDQALQQLVNCGSRITVNFLPATIFIGYKFNTKSFT